jgi:ABC-2 type transport system ATP-binding protein
LTVAAEVMTAIGTAELTLDRETRRIALPVSGGTDALVRTVRALDGRGIAPIDLVLRRPTLDDVFLALTGHAAEEEATK